VPRLLALEQITISTCQEASRFEHAAFQVEGFNQGNKHMNAQTPALQSGIRGRRSLISGSMLQSALGEKHFRESHGNSVFNLIVVVFMFRWNRRCVASSSHRCMQPNHVHPTECKSIFLVKQGLQ